MKVVDFVAFFLFGALSLGARADWVVTALAQNGGAIDHVLLEKKTAGPNASWQMQNIRVQDRLTEGEVLRVPASVELQLTSSEGMNIYHSYGASGELKLLASNGRRNALVVLAGYWLFKLETQLDSVTVIAGRSEALIRNTEFAVTYDTARGEAIYKVDEGSIEVQRDIRLQVAGRSAATLKQRHILKAGDPPYVLPDTAEAYLVNYGSFDDAVAVFTAGLDAAHARGDSVAEFNALLALGDVERAAGRGSEARRYYNNALALVSSGQRDGYLRAQLQGRLGDVWMIENRFSEAATAYRISMSEHDAQPPIEGLDAVNDQRANLVTAQLADGTYECADVTALQVLAALDARPATHFHPTRAQMLGVRGSVALGLGRPASSAVAFNAALDLWRRILHPKTINGVVVAEEIISPLIGAGYAEQALGRLDDADIRYREARTSAERLFSAPHWLQADARLGAASLLAARGQLEAAIAEAGQILDLLNSTPPDVLRRGDVLAVRGQWLLAQGLAADAVVDLIAARDRWRVVWSDYSHPRFAFFMPMLARALREVGGPAAETQARAAEADAVVGAQALAARERACLQ